jgi:hypothetical protein
LVKELHRGDLAIELKLRGNYAMKSRIKIEGTFYQNNWNVVFNNTYPRIVLLAAFNDWSEQMGLWINDTAASPYSPSPGYNMSGAVRPLEVWTLPDENITLDGYWNYTIAAICYLRNGTSTACSGGTRPKPAWPQASANLALGATVSTSSSIGGLPGSNVNDGNASTVWSSQLDSSPNSTEWVQRRAGMLGPSAPGDSVQIFDSD